MCVSIRTGQLRSPCSPRSIPGAAGKLVDTKDQEQKDRQITRFAELVRSCDKERPSPKDLSKLREMLTATDWAWKIAGNLFGFAIDALTKSLSSRVAVRDSISASCDRLKRTYGYDKATAAERLLIEQVVLSNLHLNSVSCLYSQAMAR